MENWNQTTLTPEFSGEGVSCYRVKNDQWQNQYYIVTEADSTKLLNSPEVISFDVYRSLVKPTAHMMRYFYEKGQVSKANILSILRGALNYPVEESCYQMNIPVHDISFLSCERVIENGQITGLDIRYNKLCQIPNSTLIIGDIIASGETLIHCLRHVFDEYQKKNIGLRNIIFFTIGGTMGIELTEQLTRELRQVWPDFEGFIGVWYEGIFNVYKDKGVSGINWPDIDFYWKNGIVAPEYRRITLDHPLALFEKCTIYDGGARRYQIAEHIEEVLEYWDGILERADQIDRKALTDEKLGYATPISFEDWRETNHYGCIDEAICRELYAQELRFLTQTEKLSVRQIAETRIAEFKAAMAPYQL